MPANREPHKIFAACLNFYHSNSGNINLQDSSMFKQLKSSLEGYLTGLSIMHQAIFPGWLADSDHPGFLIRVEPPVVMRAPYHLICAFPSEDVLESIWQISRKVRTFPNSIICLSGSAAIIKSSIFISDIDFCEYAICSGDDLAVAMDIKHGSTDDLILRRLRVGSERQALSSNFLEARAKILSVDAFDPNLSYAKLDFIGKPKGMRPLDISNLIIICDHQWQSASLSRSFPAQEVHLDPVVVVPNALGEPYNMGRYVSFLQDEAFRYFQSGEFTKSLKRSLSLARLCFLGPISERITQFIQSSPDFIQKDIRSVSQLIEDLDALQLGNSDWLKELENAKLDLEEINKRIIVRYNSLRISDFCEVTLKSLNRALEGKDLSEVWPMEKIHE
ncbi:MAG: hypothetical protein C0464_03215 [Cyanobacteria bacterium DS2.008]|nr:hypothetical protein [Cyanobacteria bacterium DS2.008]